MPTDNCPTNLTGVIGDTNIFNIHLDRVTDGTTNPKTVVDLDLTSATIKFTAKYNRDDADASAAFQMTTSSGITVTAPATDGDLVVKIPAASTSSIDTCGEGFIDLFYDVEVTFGATNGSYVSGDVKTVLSGILTLRSSITG